MTIRSSGISPIAWLLLYNAAAVFTFDVISVISKLFYRNAMNMYDAASGILLVLAIVYTLVAQHNTSMARLSGPELKRIRQIIRHVLWIVFVPMVMCIVVVIVVGWWDGIPASTAPLLKTLQKYQLESHSRLTEVTRLRYLAVGIAAWLGKLFFDTALAVGLASTVLDPR